MPPQAAENGRFLSKEAALEREAGQQTKAAMQKAARQKRQQQVEAEMDLGDSSFDADLDLDPREMVEALPRSSSASSTDREPTGSEPAAPVHSPKMVARAKALGLTSEEIHAATPDELDELVWAKAQRQPPAETKAPEARRVEPEAPAKKPLSFKDIDLKEFAEGVSPEFAELLRNVMPRFFEAALSERDAEIKSLKEELGHVGNFLDRQVRQTKTQQLESTFAGMGAEWEPILGKGTLAKVDAGAAARRTAILDQARRTAAEKGGDVLDHVESAAETLYGTLVQKKKPPAPGKRPSPPRRQEALDLGDEAEDEGETGMTQIDGENWFSGGLMRPTNRKGADLPKGRQRAVREVAQKLREMAPGYSEGLGDEEEGIPD